MLSRDLCSMQKCARNHSSHPSRGRALLNLAFSFQEVDGAEREIPGTLQAKKRALLGQKDRLRLLKKMQSGKDRVQRKMERSRSGKGEARGGDIGSIPESKPVARDMRQAPHDLR